MTTNFDFYERLKLVGQHIPYGKVATYGQLALLCGKPKNARQVGYALRTDRVGTDFPAHRIVNGQGVLSGAGCFKTPGLQQERLHKEHITVDSDNRVNLKEHGWHHSLDDAMFFYELFKQKKI